MSQSLLHIEQTESVAAKVKKIEQFLGENFFDDRGIMYAMWFWKGNELRPFVAEDFEGASVFKTKAGTTMHDHFNYENSAYTSGIFLWSQVLRHRATGEKQALEYAAKAFHSLEQIYSLGVQNGEPGLLCKPYGSTFTHETSPDQFAPVIFALWEYRDVADEAVRRRIDEMLPAMADWWRLRDYTIVYFDHEGDWLNGPIMTPQYGPEYIAMHLIAYKITGKAVYREEADRILKLVGDFPTRFDVNRRHMMETGKTWWPERLHGREYDSSRRAYMQMDWESYCAVWYGDLAATWLFDNEPALQPLLAHAIANYYRVMCNNLTPDLLQLYWSQTDLGTGKAHPLVVPRQEYLMPASWDFLSYLSEVCFGDGTVQVCDMALLAHRYAPHFSPGALELAKKMLAKLDDQRLHWMIDPTGSNLMPGDRWMADALSSEVPAETVLTYWRARNWGIDVEKPAAVEV